MDEYPRRESITPHRHLDTKRSEYLPHTAESHGNRLAVHAPGSVAAQERDHLRDLARLQHPLLGVDGGALALPRACLHTVMSSTLKRPSRLAIDCALPD